MNKISIAKEIKKLERRLIKLGVDYDKNAKAFLKRARIYKKAAKVQARIDELKEEIK